MKWLIAIIATLSIIGVGRAQSVVPVNSGLEFENRQFSAVINGFTNATPNSATTIYVAPALYHTVQFTATNAASYCIDSSIDNTNFALGATNALTANVTAEATLTKKTSYLRIRLQGTNSAVTINYLGGR